MDDKTKISIAETIQIDIDEFSESLFESEHRNHLGASTLADPCERKIWFTFRWAKKPNFALEDGKRTHGQMLRLFNRGHREEVELRKLLEGIGCKFFSLEEQQIQISDFNGHFGGSLDGLIRLPEKFGIDALVIPEYKTANFTQFNQCKKKGVRAKYKTYWGQVCLYGFKTGINYCLFIIVDKNSDEIYIEFLEIDHSFGEELYFKAQKLIEQQSIPDKISNNQKATHCKYCNFKDICFNNEPIEINCRSCKNSHPTKDKQWFCNHYNTVIPLEHISKGCDNHFPVH